METLVHRALGTPVQRAKMATTEVTIAKVAGKPVLYVASRLSPARARWCVAWEFTGWAMREDGFDAAEIRRLRAATAADLLLPGDMARRLFRVTTALVVANEFVIPTAAVLLREAELLRLPTALVVPGRYVRIKGDDDGRLPLERAALELLASKRGIGVVRFPVPEEGGTVVRLAA